MHLVEIGAHHISRRDRKWRGWGRCHHPSNKRSRMRSAWGVMDPFQRATVPGAQDRCDARPFFRSPKCECRRSEEHTSELQSLMRISYAVFCLKKKKNKKYKQKLI